MQIRMLNRTREKQKTNAKQVASRRKVLLKEREERRRNEQRTEESPQPSTSYASENVSPISNSRRENQLLRPQPSSSQIRHTVINYHAGSSTFLTNPPLPSTSSTQRRIIQNFGPENEERASSLSSQNPIYLINNRECYGNTIVEQLGHLSSDQVQHIDSLRLRVGRAFHPVELEELSKQCDEHAGNVRMQATWNAQQFHQHWINLERQLIQLNELKKEIDERKRNYHAMFPHPPPPQ